VLENNIIKLWKFHTSQLISKANIKIYKTIILPVILYGIETRSLTPRGTIKFEGVWKKAQENIITYKDESCEKKRIT
jgi:hypothetical protein